MTKAFLYICYGNKLQNKKFTSKQSEKAKKLVKKAISPTLGKKHSKETKQKMSDKALGRKHTNETKEKIGEASRNREPISEETRLKLSLAASNISEETRLKRSNAAKNRKFSEETKEKMSTSAKNKEPMSEETKEKLRKACIGPKKRVICPYCGKEGGVNVMHRFHFDNCKNKNFNE